MTPSRRRPPRTGLFVHRSIVPGRAADVFAWHERPDALLDLLPSRRWVRIEHRAGGIRNGGRVALSFGIGPLRIRWEARHFGFVPGEQFCDEQVRGPFTLWRHTHRVEPVGDSASMLEDRIEYLVPGGPLVRRAAEPLLQRLLARAFIGRHEVVREAFEDKRARRELAPWKLESGQMGVGR
jgi:ligand-binding SRPBCC domain-containing protein